MRLGYSTSAIGSVNLKVLHTTVIY